MQQVRAFEIREVSLRSAALIKRACAPTVVSPISPSSSALVTKRRDRIDHDDVERVGADQSFTDAQRFFTRARLRDQQIIKVNAELLRILRIKRMLDVDEGGEAAAFLRLRDDGERKRRFAGGFRAENFDNAAAREIRRRPARDRSKCSRSE